MGINLICFSHLPSPLPPFSLSLSLCRRSSLVTRYKIPPVPFYIIMPKKICSIIPTSLPAGFSQLLLLTSQPLNCAKKIITIVLFDNHFRAFSHVSKFNPSFNIDPQYEVSSHHSSNLTCDSSPTNPMCIVCPVLAVFADTARSRDDPPPSSPSWWGYKTHSCARVLFDTRRSSSLCHNLPTQHTRVCELQHG